MAFDSDVQRTDDVRAFDRDANGTGRLRQHPGPDTATLHRNAPQRIAARLVARVVTDLARAIRDMVVGKTELGCDTPPRRDNGGD